MGKGQEDGGVDAEMVLAGDVPFLPPQTTNPSSNAHFLAKAHSAGCY